MTRRLSGTCLFFLATLFVQAQERRPAGAFAITPKDRAFWSFQPLAEPALPLEGAADQRGPLDRHLASDLRRLGLSLNPPATRHALVRRAHFDLLGLPPSFEAVQAFQESASPVAWERLVDRLLASPRFGERFGRHWLDLARYAETNGYERDGPKPNAWRYRDYVIDAFNADKPYDQFIREQLAGDLADAPKPDSLVATGFYRLHVWDDEPDNTEAADFDELDDMLSTAGSAFLGMTFNCARCHDHKFDPISQKEYYQLLSCFRNVELYGRPHKGGGSRSQGAITRPLVARELVDRWAADRRARREVVQRRWNEAKPEEKLRFQTELNQIDAEQPPYPMALAISECPGEGKPTHVLRRGDPSQKAERVHPAIPAIFGGGQLSGRRDFAAWVASAKNPLTARVMANRLWRYLFGQGLVPTPNDFGGTGLVPVNPTLLDYLASRLVEGWSLKRTIREIVTSQAYQMSSDVRSDGVAADENNAHFWRQNPRRVEGEVIRDGLLSHGGGLNLKMAGPSFFPELSKEVRGTQDSADKGWGTSPPSERHRRSVYLYAKRALPLPLLTSFDADLVAFSVGARPVTTVAPQALMLLNDAFVQEQAQTLAERLLREAGGEVDARVRRAFALVVQRLPSERELALCRTLLSDQAKNGQEVAWRSLCVAMLNLNEAWHLD